MSRIEQLTQLLAELPPRRRRLTRKEMLDLLASRMRERNLSTGSGCKSTAKAIELYRQRKDHRK